MRRNTLPAGERRGRVCQHWRDGRRLHPCFRFRAELFVLSFNELWPNWAPHLQVDNCNPHNAFHDSFISWMLLSFTGLAPRTLPILTPCAWRATFRKRVATFQPASAAQESFTLRRAAVRTSLRTAWRARTAQQVDMILQLETLKVISC